MSESTSPLIEVTELEAQLSGPGIVVVDCRFNLLEPDAGRDAWRAGHIPGAVYAHLDEDLARPAQPEEGRHPLPVPTTFASTLGRLGISAGSTVVVYDDQGGAIAARLWWMLGWIGHSKHYLLNGGIQAWQAAELPLESGTSIPSAVDYGPVTGDGALVASTAEIAALRSQAESPARLLDARAAVRYRGDAEPIDPVAGHVPHARNLPFSDLLDDNGKFKPPEALRSLLGDADSRDNAVIAMCGSGVTACLLLAGLEIAGIAAAGNPGRLYVGSWSEWIRDSSREVAVGD